VLRKARFRLTVINPSNSIALSYGMDS
jgi:hypothetical protein